jgi:hypothetical protein
MYIEEEDGTQWRNRGTNIVSVVSIFYELISGQQAFPVTLPAAFIMRKVMSDSPRDRPTLDDDWGRMREIGFGLFRDVSGSFHPALPGRAFSSALRGWCTKVARARQTRSPFLDG